MRAVRAALAAFLLLVSPAFAADDTLPLAGMTCQQFLDSSKADTILTWMMGYMQDADQPAVIRDFAEIWRATERLLQTKSQTRGDVGIG